MSDKTILKLSRQDKLNRLSSYIQVYDTKQLSSVNKKNNTNILRVIKKAILGTNFCYWYTKNNIFASAIANFVIINTCFILFPQIVFNSINMKKIMEEIDNMKQDEKKMLSSEGVDFLFRLSISNFIDIGLFASLILFYKYKERKINKYMEIYTQYAIKEENDILIKDKMFCEITSDDFDIEIKKSKNNYSLSNNNKDKQEYFFKYVINFPNVREISRFLYHKIYNEKEKEIINNIISISDEVEYKYKRKLIKFIFIIVSIIVCFSVFSFISTKKKLDMINYVGIFSLFIFVQLNIFFKNKKEQINYVSRLNDKYFKDGYYIYINSDIISIFYLKDEYRYNTDVKSIRKINEKFMKKYEIYF